MSKTAEHAEFHSKAAQAARQTARELFTAAKFNSGKATYRLGLSFDRLAAQHELCAGGTSTMGDCPDCVGAK